MVDGHPKLVLGLMWSLMEYFAVIQLQVDGLDLITLRKRITHWLLAHTVPAGAIESPFELTTSNLAKSLQDGQVLFAVLHHFQPAECRPHAERATGDAALDLAEALAELESLFGVEKLLDPNIKLEDRFATPYLVQLIAKLTDRFPAARRLNDPLLDSPPASAAAAAAAAIAAAEAKEQELAATKEAALQDVAALHVNLKQYILICFFFVILCFYHLVG